MKKITLLALLFLSTFSFATDVSEAENLIRNQAKVILENLSKNQSLYEAQPQEFHKLLNKEALPYLDFSYMARFVLGRNWNGLEQNKKDEFEQAFREFLVRAYSKGWNAYAGSSVDEALKFLNKPVLDKNNRTQIKIQVKNKKGNPANVNFSLREKNGAWKIYDVEFENVSFLLSYRSSFENILQKEGIDSLISKLKSGSIAE